MVKGTSRRMEAVSREYTVNLGKALHNISFKRRAPRAVKEIRKFVQKQMLTKEVKVDVKLNKAVWSKVRARERAWAGQLGGRGGDEGEAQFWRRAADRGGASWLPTGLSEEYNAIRAP